MTEDGSRTYSHVQLDVNADERTAVLTMAAPDSAGPSDVASIRKAGADWWLLKAFRELDDALLHLRLNLLDIGTVTLRTKGPGAHVLAIDALVEANQDDWFINEVKHYVKRTLKRLDYTAKTFFALGDEDSSFVGCLFELALAADRFFMLDDPDEAVSVTLSAANAGLYPMGNGLSRLETRFLGEPESVGRALETAGDTLTTAEAYDLGLVTFNPDDIDWDDEVRVAVEERRAMSPDALTGMEANLRFAGPETLETKIFGRLSAWQNWIFQRPNAVGKEGA